MERIMDSLAEMRLVAEGAIALFEQDAAGSRELVGAALYLLRERLDDCLTACQQAAEKGVK